MNKSEILAEHRAYLEKMAESGAGEFYKSRSDSANSADDPLILGQYDLRDIEESLGEGDVAWAGGWQDEHDEVDGPLDGETDDSIDELLQHWKHQPDQGATPSWKAVLKNTDMCNRCGKKVYPVEKLDVGVVYHRSCFRCRVCGRTLTIQSFQREVDSSSRIKEVYCSQHVPKYSRAHIDSEAMGIRGALEAQRIKAMKTKEHVNVPQENWQYDDYKKQHPGSLSPEREAEMWEDEFGKRREFYSLDQESEPDEKITSTPGKLPSQFEKDEARKRDSQMQKEKKQQEWEEQLRQQKQIELEQQQLKQRQKELDEQKRLQQMQKEWEEQQRQQRQIELEEKQLRERQKELDEQKRLQQLQREWEEQQRQQQQREREERQRLQEQLDQEKENMGTMTLRRQRSILTSFSDFEKHGVFDAQQALEKMHRKEEDELYRQIFEERQRKVRALERAIKMEKEAVVKELVAFFEKKGSSGKEREKGHRKVELYYRKRHQEQLKALLQQLAAEEQAAASRMIEKHSNEMLQLIEEKERQAGGMKIYDIDLDEVPRKDGKHGRGDGVGPAGKGAPSARDSILSNDSLLSAPDVEPPKELKENLYDDPEIFKDFDNRAIEESKKDHRTFTDLVKRLSWRCETELQKVRAIFRWISIKDLNKIKFDADVDPDSPLGLLRGIKFGTESYHDLFKRLCSYAGLHCEIIEGYSKGAGYRPSSKIQGDTFRNQWTAVWVDGSWRFINCKWGARHVKGPRDGTLTYKCDEFYFLTNPEQHIYQHYPDDPAWQLLKEPITIEEFIRLPVVKSPFFNNKLSFALDYDATLKAEDGNVEIRLKSQKLLPIAARLRAKSKEVPQDILADRTLIRAIEKDLGIIINLPSPGQYYLDFYIAGDFSARSMDNACAFMIHCTGISRDANMTFPPVGTFGSTPYANHYGISPESHKDPYIAPSCETTVTFSLLKNVKLTHSLTQWDPRDRSMVDYERYALLRSRSDALASYLISFPRRGVYVFSVFASDHDDKEDTPRCVFRYFIECKVPKMDAQPFPKTSRRWKYCKLMEPLKGELEINQKVRFVLESKLAAEIVVVVNEQWYSLHNNGKLWDGVIDTGGQAGKVIIYGKFEAKSEKYIPLLEYKLLDRTKPKYVYMTNN